ncbi:alkaline phosphatase [Steroidobacter agaridevorans]|uniref:Alkaline phosphatase n=1 Tax=Steroidobacter agaridevorans TaxID=2695856 RepID=A0A829Y6C3_9GAMM|nr:alkaline phosphatase D family protein [Steroidobacter agaridevorans]GFE78777.1 alkaline phosphatase [Steroidobacter agaridevorans]GFE89290.1 alkaline phosphatase [Steroidobacter agaridevorans]
MGNDRTPYLFGRRGFLTGMGAALLSTAVSAQTFSPFDSKERLGGYPFTMGIASGEPSSDGFVLWTRLAPKPLEPGGGMPDRPVLVRWQIALDERMRKVVRRGAALALPELAHSVHVELDHLPPGRWYWYQFEVGGEVSPVGRVRTAPLFGPPQRELTFAFASCQNWVNGFFPAYRRMAEEDLDFVVHLGDYIYEGPGGAGVRAHLPATEIMSIDDYRIRHAQYKSDAALQSVHAKFPWIVTWDDHELENNYAGFIPQDEVDTPIFADRRARAYQAYYEHMPLRRFSFPRGPNLQLYRRLSFGSLLQVHVLDTRQYRSAGAPEGCAVTERVDGYCPSALDASRSIAGQRQRDWLIDGLNRSRAQWNVLANQVPFAPNDGNADPAIKSYGGEKWDGYPFDRAAILDFITAQKLSNTVVITGDVHQNYVRNVPPDYINLDAEPVATEFIGTSISSGGDRTLRTTYGGDVNNPHQLFQNNSHGYVRCEISREQWKTDYRVVPSVVVEDAPISTLASFVVEQGKAGALKV